MYKYYVAIEHLDCSNCKTLGTIFKVDEGRTVINEPDNKKTHDDA